MSDCDCSIEVESANQSRVLVILLAINAAMFLAELIAGIVAESAGLIADSIDMLADATVYGIAFFAVGKSVRSKVHAAYLSGIFQILIAIGVAGEILRRVIWGSEPEPMLMIVISILALGANVACLMLIAKHRGGEVHMRASWIFSKNDVTANIGVLLAGGLVYLLGSRVPDLAIGTVIVAVVLRGGLKIIAEARRELTIGATP